MSEQRTHAQATMNSRHCHPVANLSGLVGGGAGIPASLMALPRSNRRRAGVTEPAG